MSSKKKPKNRNGKKPVTEIISDEKMLGGDKPPAPRRKLGTLADIWPKEIRG